MRVFKAFRLRKDRKPGFLFHGLEGTLAVPLNRWIRAERKIVDDGGHTKYESGFHVFVDEAAIAAWKRSTKTQYYVIEVKVKKTRPKRHSRNKGILLADWLYVSSEDWEAAI